MLRKILGLLASVFVLLLLVIALQPDDFRIERRATLNAPAAAVFPHVNDFHLWNTWSPWAKIDPAMQQSFTGAAAGKGAVYSWNGNKDVGEGRMTILESRAPELVRINLEFIAPFKATNLTEFNFKGSGNQTEVTWSMSGHNDFMLKAVGLFMNMDKTVGGDFERGLAQLKSVAEGAAKR